MLLLPFFTLTPGPGFMSQRVVFMFPAWLLLAWFTKDVWILSFVVYVIIWQLFLMVGVMGGAVNYERQLIAVSMCNRIMWGVFLLVVVQRYGPPFNTLANAICVATLIHVGLCFFQEYVGRRLTGGLMLENAVTSWLAIATPFFFRKYWVAFLLPIGFLLFNMLDQVSGILSVGIATAVFISPWILLASVPLATSIFFWLLSNQAVLLSIINKRLVNWDIVLNHIFASPLVALFGYVSSRSGGVTFPIHNEFLGVWFTWGLVGLVLAIGFIVHLPKNNRILLASLCGLLAHCISFYCMRIPPVAYLSLIIFGVMKRNAVCSSRANQ